MRKLQLSWTPFFLILTIALLFSCKSDDDDNVNDDGEYLTAVIDGATNFEATTSPDNFIRARIHNTSNKPRLEVFGHFNDDGHEEIVLGVFDYNGAGTYFVGNTERPLSMYLDYTRANVAYGANGNDGSGTLTVTTDNKEYIQGTFNFVGVNGIGQIEVTQGDFKAFYDFITIDY